MNYKILENVYISSNGMIFDENMNVLKISRLHDTVYTENFNYSSIKKLPDGDYVDLTHYYSFCPFSHRYDIFSRIRHIEELITPETNFLIGNIATEQRFTINRFKEESELFGIKNKIYHPDNNTLFKIKKLIYPDWLFGEAPCAFTPESFVYCRNKYNSYFKKTEKKFKVFLTRASIARVIMNADFVHKFLEKDNFVILNGSEDLETTINYFYNSDIIVGIHGGMFSNLIFCGDVNKIIEIFPSSRYNGCFVGWNKYLKTNYKTLIFESDNSDNIFFEENMLNTIQETLENK
jgi:hypothetical protein